MNGFTRPLYVPSIDLYHNKKIYHIPHRRHMKIKRTYDDIYRSVYKCKHVKCRKYFYVRYDKNKNSCDKTFTWREDTDKKIIGYYRDLDCEHLYQVGSYLVNNGVIPKDILTYIILIELSNINPKNA